MLTLALAQQCTVSWPQSLQWLAPGERARLATQGSPARRQQFLAGRWLLRQLASTGPLDIDAEGRSHRPQGHANLSHSGGWVLAGAADGPVGVDLEALRPRRDVMGLARMVLGAGQCEALQVLPPDAALVAFYRSWTLKEAWFKARGQGLDLTLIQRLDFAPVRAHGGEAAPAADSACAVLHAVGLVLAVHQPRGLGALPDSLAGYRLPWQRFVSGVLDGCPAA